MKRLLWLVLLTAGCGAAASARYTESDNRQTISADIETVFYVSLPETMTARPVFSPNILRLNKDGADAATHQRTLEFTARALGETDLKVGADFSLHVRVTSASDRPDMHIHQH